MKILIINTLYDPYIFGGAEVSVRQLANQLIKSGHRVIILTTFKEDLCEVQDGLEVLRFKTNPFYWFFEKSKNGKLTKLLWHVTDLFNYFYSAKLLRLLKEINPDVVHTNNLAGFSTVIWKLVKRQNVKLVHTVRDYYLLCFKSSLFKDKRNCNQQCFECKLVSRIRSSRVSYVDRMVFISDSIKDEHRKFGVATNVPHDIIYNSVNQVEPISGKKYEVDTLDIGFIGRLQDEKGIGLFLESAKSIIEGYPNLNITIAGEGDEEYVRELKEKYSHPRIHFVGFIMSSDFFERIDILAVPSLWKEPFGRVIIEAFSFGIPVIANEIGGAKELVSQDRGWLVKQDVASWNVIISKLATKDIRVSEFKDNCLSFAKYFSTEEVAEQYLDCYKKAIKSS